MTHNMNLLYGTYSLYFKKTSRTMTHPKIHFTSKNSNNHCMLILIDDSLVYRKSDS